MSWELLPSDIFGLVFGVLRSSLSDLVLFIHACKEWYRQGLKLINKNLSLKTSLIYHGIQKNWLNIVTFGVRDVRIPNDALQRALLFACVHGYTNLARDLLQH